MTESLPSASSPESKAGLTDKLRDELVANYLCAANPKDEERALAALRQDEFRLEMAGMAPEWRGFWNQADKIDWKAVQREGLTSVMPVLFGAYIGLTASPEDATRIATALGGAGLGFEFLSMAAAVPEAIAKHQRASGLAKAIAAVRVVTFYAGKVGVFAALGTGVAALAHRGLLETQAAATAQGEVGSQPDAGLYGQQANPPAGISETAWQARRDEIQRLPTIQPPPETVVPQLPQVPIDAGEAQLQAAQAEAEAQAELANRLAVLNDGGVVGDLAKEANSAPWDTVRKIVGDVAHGGEITNALTRALGDKLSGLHEGAIREAAKSLQPVFDKIDATVLNSGVPYTEGGLGAVEALHGPNSAEAQLIRAANTVNLEAAAHVMDKVITPAIAPVLIQ